MDLSIWMGVNVKSVIYFVVSCLFTVCFCEGTPHDSGLSGRQTFGQDVAVSKLVIRSLQPETIQNDYYSYLKNKHLQLIHLSRQKRGWLIDDPGNRAGGTPAPATPGIPVTPAPETPAPPRGATVTEATTQTISVDPTSTAHKVTLDQGSTTQGSNTTSASTNATEDDGLTSHSSNTEGSTTQTSNILSSTSTNVTEIALTTMSTTENNSASFISWFPYCFVMTFVAIFLNLLTPVIISL